MKVTYICWLRQDPRTPLACNLQISRCHPSATFCHVWSTHIVGKPAAALSPRNCRWHCPGTTCTYRSLTDKLSCGIVVWCNCFFAGFQLPVSPLCCIASQAARLRRQEEWEATHMQEKKRLQDKEFRKDKGRLNSLRFQRQK